MRFPHLEVFNRSTPTILHASSRTEHTRHRRAKRGYLTPPSAGTLWRAAAPSPTKVAPASESNMGPRPRKHVGEAPGRAQSATIPAAPVPRRDCRSGLAKGMARPARPAQPRARRARLCAAAAARPRSPGPAQAMGPRTTKRSGAGSRIRAPGGGPQARRTPNAGHDESAPSRKHSVTDSHEEALGA